MKIILNIEKKHLVFFSLFLVLVGSVFVIATEWVPFDQTKPYHEILYTNMIGPVSGNVIDLMDAALEVRAGNEKGIVFGRSDNRPQLYRIYATINSLNYGDERTKNIFRGQICDGEDRCKPTSEMIGSDENVQRHTLTDPKKNDKVIIANRNSAEKFCEETGYPRLVRYEGIACGERNESSIEWNRLNNVWLFGTCLGNVQKIVSITCERDIQIEEIQVNDWSDDETRKKMWGDSGWTGTCPEGKTLIGLKQELSNQNRDGVIKIICK